MNGNEFGCLQLQGRCLLVEAGVLVPAALAMHRISQRFDLLDQPCQLAPQQQLTRAKEPLIIVQPDQVSIMFKRRAVTAQTEAAMAMSRGNAVDVARP